MRKRDSRLKNLWDPVVLLKTLKKWVSILCNLKDQWTFAYGLLHMSISSFSFLIGLTEI